MSKKVSIPGAEVQIGDWVQPVSISAEALNMGMGAWGPISDRKYYYEVATIDDKFIGIYGHDRDANGFVVSNPNSGPFRYLRSEKYYIWDDPMLKYDPTQMGDKDDDI